MKKIEKTILNAKSEKLQSKYEEERAELDVKLELFEGEIVSQTVSETRMRSLIQKAQALFEDPIALWSIGNPALKELLISVRF